MKQLLIKNLNLLSLVIYIFSSILFFFFISIQAHGQTQTTISSEDTEDSRTEAAFPYVPTDHCCDRLVKQGEAHEIHVTEDYVKNILSEEKITPSSGVPFGEGVR